MKTKQWTHSLPAKIIVFFLLIVMACTTVGCVVGGIILAEENFYTKSINEIKENTFYPFIFRIVNCHSHVPNL